MGTGAAHTAIGVEAFRAADKIEAEKEVKKVALDWPAFPGQQDRGFGTVETWPGITTRDYFAAKAMQYFLAEEHMCDQQDIAKAAYSMADAMLEARTK